MATGRSIDQLAGDPHPLARLADAALKDVAHAEFTSDLLDVDGPALVGEATNCARSRTSDLKRESAVMISSTMPSAKYSCSGSPLMFWNGSTAMDGLSGSASRRCQVPAEMFAARRGVELASRKCRKRASARRCSSGSAGRRSSKTKSTLPRIWPMSVIGDAHAARLGYPFEPRRDVDAVAEDVVIVDDDVADVDTDPEFDPDILRYVWLFCPAMPRWISIAQRAASTALANSTSMPSPVVFTMRPRCAAIAGSTSVFRSLLRLGQRAFFVDPHQAAVPGDIRHQHSYQSPFYPFAGQEVATRSKIRARVSKHDRPPFD